MVRCDLLVVNKIDLAPYVGVNLELLLHEADLVRSGKPIVSTNARTGDGIAAVVAQLDRDVLFV